MRSRVERFEDGEADVVLHDVAVEDVGEEDADLELQRRRPEIGEQHERLGVLQHQRMAARDLAAAPRAARGIACHRRR